MYIDCRIKTNIEVADINIYYNYIVLTANGELILNNFQETIYDE